MKIKSIIMKLRIYWMVVLFVPFTLKSEGISFDMAFAIRNIVQNTEQLSDHKSSQEEKKEDTQSKEPIEAQNTEDKKSTEVTQNQKQEKKEKAKLDKEALPKSSLEGCIQSLQSQDPAEQLVALKQCAKNYKKDEKMIQTLLTLLENSNYYEVQKNSLLLLSNQRKSDIARKLVEWIQNGKFRSQPNLQYAAVVSLLSVATEDVKDGVKQILEDMKNSKDEFLKDLAEKIRKKSS